MKNFISKIAPDKSDCLLLIGVIAVFFGVYQIYPPAAYIVLGLGCIFLGGYTAYLKTKVAIPEGAE